MPKNSPFLTSKDIPFSACWVSYPLWCRNRPVKCPFSVVVFSCGSLNCFDRFLTETAICSSILDILRKVSRAFSEVSSRYNYQKQSNAYWHYTYPVSVIKPAYSLSLIRHQNVAAILDDL